MPSPHCLYGLRVILMVSAYFYMDMNCFRLVCVVSSRLRVGLVAVDTLAGWLRMVLGGCGWFQVVSGGFRWFRVVCCFSSYVFLKHFEPLEGLLSKMQYIVAADRCSQY